MEFDEGGTGLAEGQYLTAEMMDLDADSVTTAQRGRKQRGTDAEVAQVSTLVSV
jgi:hypothetical protein